MEAFCAINKPEAESKTSYSKQFTGCFPVFCCNKKSAGVLSKKLSVEPLIFFLLL